MNRLILFFRGIRPGMVKTRLAAELGEEAALAIYEAMLEDAANCLEEWTRNPRIGRPEKELHPHNPARPSTPGNSLWDRHVQPVRAQSSGQLPGATAYVDAVNPPPLRDPGGLLARARPQTGTTLEQRMDAAFTDAFAEGAERAVLIGSDIPGLSAETFRDAFRRLESCDAVIGPSMDGGYYLVGFTRHAYQSRFVLFTGPQGGTPFEAVVQALRSAGIRPEALPAMVDVDTAADLAEVYRRHQGEHPRLDRAVRRFAPHLLPAGDRG